MRQLVIQFGGGGGGILSEENPPPYPDDPLLTGGLEFHIANEGGLGGTGGPPIGGWQPMDGLLFHGAEFADEDTVNIQTAYIYKI